MEPLQSWNRNRRSEMPICLFDWVAAYGVGSGFNDDCLDTVFV